MKQDCSHCQRQLDRTCLPADVFKCFRNGRHTRFLPLAGNVVCPVHQERLLVKKTDPPKDGSNVRYVNKRCPVCAYEIRDIYDWQVLKPAG